MSDKDERDETIRRQQVLNEIINDMLAMPMNSVLHPEAGEYEILRVPGGWVYTRFNVPALSSCFVPLPETAIKDGGLV